MYEVRLRTKADGANPYASPLHALSLHGLPPATVINAEDAVLWSEGEAYAMRLRAAGVPTTWTRYAGVTHEFFGMSVALEQARMAVAQVTGLGVGTAYRL